MPAVPYNPVANVSPSGQGTPYFSSAGATPDAFGANIGHAEERLGAQIEKTADTIEQRVLAAQQLANESTAKEADVNAALQIGSVTNDFYVKEGKNAALAYPDYQQQIKKIREDALQGLNPAARKMADVAISRRAEFALIDGGRHTAQQDKVYANQASTARVAIAINDAGIDPYDEARWNNNVGVIRSETLAQGEQGGWSKERVQQQTEAHVSKAYQTRINSIAQRDPFAAKDFYDKHINEITDPVMRNTIEQTLIRQANVVGTRIRADEIESGKSYDQKVIQQESGGRPGAKATTSSAGGLAGFTDPTWKSLREAHPELKLTDKGQFNPDEVKRALPVFTAENQAKLAAGGIETNDKNTYMAHFLGAAGAVTFLKGMQDNPDAPAASLVSKSAAEANKSVFFNPDGTPKSAQEVYNNQTAKFGGPEGKLTGASSGEWLQKALAQAGAMAQHDAPDGQEYKQLLETRVINRFNQAKNVQRLTDQGNFNDVYSHIIGGGDPAKAVKDIDDVFSNPDMNGKYQNLPPAMQQRVLNRVLANAKPDVHMTPERVRSYQTAMGMAITDPVAFQNLDTSSMDLPWAQQNAIFKAQQDAIKKTKDTTIINSVLNNAAVKSVMNSVGFPPDKADDGGHKRYNQFVGALNESLLEYAEKNKKQMSPEEQIKEVGRLVAEQSSSWFGGSVKNYQVPEDFKKAWKDRLTTKYGHEPNDLEWGKFHQHYVMMKAQDAVK